MAKKPTIIIAEEDEQPERQYFDHISKQFDSPIVRVERRKSYSDPKNVLDDMRVHLEKAPFPQYQAYIVVDRDTHDSAQIDDCVSWVKEDSRHHLVLSNPCIEFWLLMHFWTKVQSDKAWNISYYNGLPIKDRSDYTKKCWNNFTHDNHYNHCNIKGIGITQIRNAIVLAKNFEKLSCENSPKCYTSPPCPDYPHHRGSTAYRLLENILSAAGA